MKYKYSFFNDYSEGAHQNILDALLDSNLTPEGGYSEDSISQQAIHLIKQHIKTPSPNISSYFVAKQQRSLWIQGLRKKMIQAHSELCNWSFFPENAVDAGLFVVAVEI
jgi:hypothetical protein